MPSRSRLFLATVLSLAGGCALAVALWSPRVDSVAALFALACSVLALVPLIRPLREDPDAVLLWLGGISLSAALILGTYVLSAYQPGPNPKTALSLAALVGITALAWTAKRQWAPEDSDFPNVLAEIEPRGPIRETNGVQFAIHLTPGDEARPHRIDVYLQNCCDGPRTVGYRFRGPILRKALVSGPANIELGPAEVRRLTLWVVTSEKSGRTSVDLFLPVVGDGGRRVRLQRAFLSRARSRSSQVGSKRLMLDPQPEALWNAPFPLPQNELLWKPRRGAPLGSG